MHDYELYGYSVFETLLADNGRFFRLQQHWFRLCRAAARFNLTAPSLPAFIEQIRQIHDPNRDEVIRYSLLRQGGRWAHEATPKTEVRILKRSHSPSGPTAFRLGLAPWRFPCRDPLRTFKTGSRLLLQASVEAVQKTGFDDCLMVDTAGALLETAFSNLFLLLGEQWVTPSLSFGVLPGVTRQWLLEEKWAREGPLHLHDLNQCRGAVITNAVMGVMPISEIENTRIDLSTGQGLLELVGRRTFLPLADFLR